MQRLTNLHFQTSDILKLIVLIFLLVSLLAIWRSISKTFGPLGGIDAHSYWYYGHFVRQGIDPYQAYLEGVEPKLPVQYLDGVVIEAGPIAQTNLAKVPANTAPMVLSLSWLSLFSWPTAKVIWLGCNLIFMIAIPWLVISLFPRTRLHLIQILLICFTLYVFENRIRRSMRLDYEVDKVNTELTLPNLRKYPSVNDIAQPARSSYY